MTVVYPRRGVFADDRLSPRQLDVIRAVQAERHIAYTEARFTSALAPTWRHRHHRLPLPCEVRTYELTGDHPTAGFTSGRRPCFSAADFREFKLSDHLPDQGSKPVATHSLTTSSHSPGRPTSGLSSMCARCTGTTAATRQRRRNTWHSESTARAASSTEGSEAH